MSSVPILAPSISSFTTVCRTCLSSEQQGKLYRIEDVFWTEDIQLKGIFANWSPLEHNNKDGLPQQMCYNCIQLMYQIYKFFKKASQSEFVLKDVLQKAQKSAADVDGFELEHIIIEIKEENDNEEVDNTSNVNEDEHTENDEDVSSKPEEVDGEINEIFDEENCANKFVMKKKRLAENTKVTRSLARCTTCLEKFPNVDDLKEHRNKTHNRHFKYECKYCQLKCLTKNSLAIHTRIHTGEKPFKCDVCDKAFNTNSDLKRHTVLHLPDKPFKCRFCENEYTRKDLLFNHEKKHTHEKIKCEDCDAEFNAPRTLQQHRDSAHGTNGVTLTPTEDGKYRCGICGKILQSSQALKNHILVHGPMKYICAYCEKGFARKLSLKYHIQNTHESTMFKCDKCDKVYRQKSGLGEHMIAHHDITPFVCEVCGKTFRFRGSLKGHRRVHNGDTKYQCPTCKKILPNNRALQEHVLVHTNKKPHVCEFCGSGFRLKSNLRTHRYIHTKVRQEVCHICDRVLADPRSLKKHISRHNKDKTSL